MKAFSYHLSGVSRSRFWVSVISTLSIFMLTFSPMLGGTTPALAAITPSNGVMMAANMTLPRGAVFMNDANGGHWWVSDAVQGVCRLDANVAAPGGFQKGPCDGNVKSGGQLVVGETGPNPVAGLPAGAKYIYAADDASKSVHVVRYLFSPAGSGTITQVGNWNVPNQTQKGGGLAGGRPVGVAILPHSGGGQDLYVSYLKSGDIMRIVNPQSIANNVNNPPASKVASTSDGLGINALLAFGNDLYVSEIGGVGGMSKIPDPSGINRPACTSAAICTAVSAPATPTFFPGGLATDGTYIYVGDVPLGGSPNRILRYNPADATTEVYSQNINPSYVSAGVTYTTYSGPLGIGYNAATQDLLVGDDPTFITAATTTNQGHMWKVPHPVVVVIPTVTAINPTSGSNLGGDVVTVTGTNFDTAGGTTITFGANPGTNVVCASATSCTVTSPAGTGIVDVRVTVAGQTSPITAADQFTYVIVNPNAVTVTNVSPNTGATIGGTLVTITGTNFVPGGTAINFGANPAATVNCASTTTCTATSPAGAAGTVDITLTDVNGTSAITPADQFTYIAPVPTLYAWGVTAPKGGATWLPGALGGHWWSSDHSQGFCRQDPVPGTTLHAINYAVCGNDLVGSAGQGVYDSRPVVVGGTTFQNLHYVYVPDNAVRSTAVWRLTFDANTETMVPDPLDGVTMATAMTPLADVRTLKPNGMALGPDGNLYVSDLVEKNIRRIINPNGDPRTQTITIVAETGDGRGANGTQGFIGNLLYISGNRATQFFDITQCPMAGGVPCGMASVPAPTGIFVAGTAVDALHNLVYISNSPGGANATILRYDASHDVYVAFAAGSVPADLNGVVTCPACTVGSTAQLYITGGTLPAAGSPNATVYCALTCTRPFDLGSHPAGPGSTITFAFVFGMATDPNGTLVITEDPSAGARSGRGTMWTVPYIP